MQQSMVDALGIGALSAEEQESTLDAVGGAIFAGVMMRVLDLMPEGKQDELERLLDSKADPEVIFGYLGDNISNFAQIIKEEADKFKTGMDARMKELME